MSITIEPDQAAHSALGASAAHRWLNCPGSFRLSRTVPARRGSIYAATGTLAHSLIEATIHKGPRVLEQILGSVATVEGYEVEIDEDFVAGITTMVDYVAQDRMGPTYLEQTVYLDKLFVGRAAPPVRLFGRADVIFLDMMDNTLEVVDYKNGSGVLVDPAGNPQLLYYAIGAVLFLADEGFPFPGTIKLTVVQPHARDVQKIRSTEIDFMDLVLWVEDVLIPGVYACAAPDAPLNAGSWCRFCPASHVCPVLHDKANQMAKHDFADHTLPVTPTDLADALNTAVLAETWIDAVRGYAIEQLKSQVHIPGWGLGPTRPVRRWVDEVEAENRLLDHGFTPVVIHRNELKSPAQIEKLVKQSPGVWGELSPLVENHSSGVKLVRTDNDPRGDFDEC